MKTNWFPLFISVALLGMFMNFRQLSGEKSFYKSYTFDSINLLNKNDSIGQWKEMYFYEKNLNGEVYYFKSSSELDKMDPFEGIGKYAAINLLDLDPNTAWVEGVDGDGEGEYACVSMGLYFPESIRIKNGYQKSKELYHYNSRPEKIRLTLYTGFLMDGDVTEINSLFHLKQMTESWMVELKDTMDPQDISLPLSPEKANDLKAINYTQFLEDFREEIQNRSTWSKDSSLIPAFQYFIKIEILQTYPGTRWNDCCISDLELFFTPVENTTFSENEKIIEIYEQKEKNSNFIYVKTNKNDKIILVDRNNLPEYKSLNEEENLDIVLMDVSEDKEWAMVNVMINHKSLGKIEEYSLIYFVPELLLADESIVGTKYGIYGFYKENGSLWLDTVNGGIELEKLKHKLTKQE